MLNGNLIPHPMPLTYWLKVYQTMELLSKDSHVKLHQTDIRPVNLLFILRILLSPTVLLRLTS